MNIFSLCLAYLRHNLSGSLLSILTFASGIAVIIVLLVLQAQLGGEFSGNLKNIDLVVGAKGSPMQLILSSVFHLDIPTGNIPLDEAQRLEKHPLVKTAIPVALGDNFNGFRIVGTSPEYIHHYNGSFASGGIFQAPMQAVLGSETAAHEQKHVGDKIVGAHGLVNSDDLHTDFPYTVVGVLNPTHTVLDRLVLTPVESVWHVHEHPDEDNPDEVQYKKTHPGKELTALLIQYKSPMAAAVMPREVNQSSSMQSASPAFEVARLMHFMGAGANAIASFGWYLIALAGLGLFVTLYRAMDERRYDMALLRSLGATPSKLLLLVVTESLTLALTGALLGIALGHGGILVAAHWLAENRHFIISATTFLPEEWVLIAASALIGIMAAIIPALRVYRIDMFKTLVRG